MIAQVEAVVLRTWPIHEADQIVSLFTREHGKVKGVAKSAARSGSVVVMDAHTGVAYVNFLPSLAEGVSVNTPSINGIADHVHAEDLLGGAQPTVDPELVPDPQQLGGDADDRRADLEVAAGGDLVEVPHVRLDGVERGVVRLAVGRTEPHQR